MRNELQAKLRAMRQARKDYAVLVRVAGLLERRGEAAAAAACRGLAAEINGFRPAVRKAVAKAPLFHAEIKDLARAVPLYEMFELSVQCARVNLDK
jgi:hypothetical protein